MAVALKMVQVHVNQQSVMPETTPYAVACACGRELPVAASAAGTVLGCRCGRDVEIPRLSQLRRSSGQSDYESGIVSTIQRMIARGELPWGGTCAVSEFPTNDVVYFSVQCEEVWIKGGRQPWWVDVLIGGFTLLFFHFWNRRKQEEAEHLGRDLRIELPLRVSSDQAAILRRWAGQRRLKRLLRTIPIYSQLLDEYPAARVQLRDR